jgi:hypothetical protein
MSPVFDEQGPSINGTPGYTGQKQANIGVKEPVEKNLQIKETQNDDGTVSSRVYDAQGNVVKQNQFKGAGKTKAQPVAPADKPDLAGAKAAVAALPYAGKHDKATLTQIEKDHNLKPGTVGGSAPATVGKLSNGTAIQWTP